MKYLLLDMYGVIIKEAKGNFRQYLTIRKPESDYSLYRQYYNSASVGLMKTGDFLNLFGLTDTQQTIHDYIENFLTFDSDFSIFAERCLCNNISLVLLSNDIAEYSQYIREYYGIDKYFTLSVISGDVGIRKPEKSIFTLTLSKLDCEPHDCLFVDDNIGNLITADELGINTVRFDRESSEINKNTVCSFEELWKYITIKLKGSAF